MLIKFSKDEYEAIRQAYNTNDAEQAKVKPATDATKFPYGTHKGKQLVNVPAQFLIFAYENQEWLPDEIALYIEDNIQALAKEMKRKPFSITRKKK